MKTKISFLTIVLLAAVSAATAQSAPRAEDNRLDWFRHADTNRNGTVDRGEFHTDADALFKSLDRNDDGTIDENEIPRPPLANVSRGGDAPRPPKMPPPFAMEDANGDGKLTRAEFDANMNRHFSRVDKNADGTLTSEELTAMPKEMPPQIAPPAPTAPTVRFLGAESRFGDKLVKNAAFSAETVMENTRRLYDGATVTTRSKGAIYRDAAGRTRREQPLEAVGGFSLGDAVQTLIFITDANEKTQYFLDPKRKSARRIPFADNRAPKPPVDSDEGELEESRTESLGTKTVEGLNVEGTLTTIEIPAGKLGNDKPLQVVTERWYSSELQTVVMTRHVDPLLGEQIFRLTNIKRGEPSRELFTIPSDYRIENDRRD